MCRILIFYVVLLVGFHIYFFYEPLAGWPHHGLWVSIFSPWRGRPLQWAPAVQRSLPTFAPSLLVFLFAPV